MYRILVAAPLLVTGVPARTPGGDGAGPRTDYDDLRLPHVFAGSDEGVFRRPGWTQVRDLPVATASNLWSGTGRFAEVA